MSDLTAVLLEMLDTAIKGDEVQCAACLSESAKKIAALSGIDLGPAYTDAPFEDGRA